MACRSGCKTKDHASYAECLRSAGVGINLAATPHNAWDRELNLYRSAREQGVQPASTSTADTMSALQFSDSTGTAYDAGDKSGTLQRAGLLPQA